MNGIELPVFIPGDRGTGRTTRLLELVAEDQEGDPEMVALIVSPYYYRADSHLSREVMAYIHRWIDGKPGIDPQRTECWSASALLHKVRGMRQSSARLYVDDAPEFEDGKLHRLLIECQRSGISLRAMVVGP